MNSSTRWLGWLGICLGALGLVVALGGRGFGPQIAAGFSGPAQPQTSAQPGAGFQGAAPQGGQAAPGANNLPGSGQQGGRAAPGARGPQSQDRSGAGPQMGAGAPGADGQGGPRGRDNAGAGLGGWLSFPLRLLGGTARWAMLALAALVGFWFLRGRGGASARPAAPAPESASEPLSPTGEAYTDDSSDPE